MIQSNALFGFSHGAPLSMRAPANLVYSQGLFNGWSSLAHVS
jgi:hypothetical protein